MTGVHNPGLHVVSADWTPARLRYQSQGSVAGSETEVPADARGRNIRELGCLHRSEPEPPRVLHSDEIVPKSTKQASMAFVDEYGSSSLFLGLGICVFSM